VGDEVGVIARRSVEIDELHEDLAAGAIDGIDRRLVAIPGDLHLVEALRLDDAGVVRGIEAIDLDADGLRHVFEEGFPHLFEGAGLFSGDDAEVEFLDFGGMDDTDQSDGGSS
jgi:hypothetical protein